MPQDLIRDRAGAAPYVRPFLDALDRMQDRRTVHPEQLAEHAWSLVIERFGAAEERTGAAFSHGGTVLIGVHTHYFGGFALLSTPLMGAAVALRANPADQSSI